MKLDKESKQNIRRQKRKDMKEQHVQEVLGYLFIYFLKLPLHIFLKK